MIQIQHGNDRGRTRTDWLDSRHSFSFGGYRSPTWTGFGPLLVLNDDRIRPSSGFGAHPHRDMEILTFVTEGVLKHRDSLGSEAELAAGNAQVMRAGTGIVHAEWNGSDTDDLRLIQIWIRPRSTGLKPAYAELPFRDEAQPTQTLGTNGLGRDTPSREARYEDTRHEESLRGQTLGSDALGIEAHPSEAARSSNAAAKILTIASPDGRDGSAKIDQDAVVKVVSLAKGQRLELGEEVVPGTWLQVLDGAMTLGAHGLEAGDGVAVRNEHGLTVEGLSESRAILIEVPD